MVIYDENRLRAGQAVFAYEEAYATVHRQIIGGSVALPIIAAFVIVALSENAWWTWQLALVVVALATLASVGIYFGARAFVRQFLAKRFGVSDVLPTDA